MTGDALDAMMGAASDSQCDVPDCMYPAGVETPTGRELCRGCAYERRQL